IERDVVNRRSSAYETRAPGPSLLAVEIVLHRDGGIADDAYDADLVEPPPVDSECKTSQAIGNKCRLQNRPEVIALTGFRLQLRIAAFGIANAVCKCTCAEVRKRPLIKRGLTAIPIRNRL